jgi:hypothetical protein
MNEGHNQLGFHKGLVLASVVSNSENYPLINNNLANYREKKRTSND